VAFGAGVASPQGGCWIDLVPADRIADVAVPCDEDDWEFPVRRGELALKIKILASSGKSRDCSRLTVWPRRDG
jgi:hypothetical protein